MSQTDTSMILTLTTSEGQLVIEALAEGPFKTVFDLIGRINRQANTAGSEELCRLALSRADLALVIGALVKLPYHRVHQLMAKLEQQAAPQAAPIARKKKAA